MTDRIYNFANAIGAGRGSAYLRVDWRETKEDAKKIGRGIQKSAKWLTKNAVKLTYPLTGNLSLEIRERLENQLSKETFNSDVAGKTSALTNFIVYPILTYSLLNYFGVKDKYVAGSTMGAIQYASLEFSELRQQYDYYGKKWKNPLKASALGKVASLPLEFILGISDGIKERRKK